jgi:hypothetical protein
VCGAKRGQALVRIAPALSLTENNHA